VRTVKKVTAMQHLALRWKREGVRVVLVPTMGYLHEGHLSLVRRARRAAGPTGRVVVSIYVNPTQFGPTEDLAAYPRDLKKDLRLLREEGADAVWMPPDSEMYAGRETGDYSVYVVEESLSCHMEGASRPVHFRGVTTVVAKLFNATLPDAAVFGAKDWQQSTVIRRMVKDLNYPVKIIVAPTVRERDGLALSSRNAYLSPDERIQAGVLNESIRLARQEIRAAAKPIPVGRLRRKIENFVGRRPLGRLDYVEFFHPDTLTVQSRVGRGSHMALAVFFGRARLIDNGRL
jgi:pantoate--beta-alanine ligase